MTFVSGSRNSEDVASLRLSSESDVENESKKETSLIHGIAINASEQKDGTGKSKSPEEPNHRLVRKGSNVNRIAGKISAKSTSETSVRHAVKEQSPTPLNISISKTTKGKPRKRAALIKLKRGKPRKKWEFLWSN